jgi:hypothetical protein
MAEWIFQTTSRFGTAVLLDFRQGSLDNDFAAMHAGAGPKIDNVIGPPHCLFVVLDNHE